MTELSPCPFCGCPGQEFKDFWDSGQIDCFGCKDCGISFERAEEWNRRETPPQPASAPALLKVLREARRFVENDPTALTSSPLLTQINEVLRDPVGTAKGSGK